MRQAGLMIYSSKSNEVHHVSGFASGMIRSSDVKISLKELVECDDGVRLYYSTIYDAKVAVLPESHPLFNLFLITYNNKKNQLEVRISPQKSIEIRDMLARDIQGMLSKIPYPKEH
jgi:hypothetical protein